MILTRRIPLIELELALCPDYILISYVNEMRNHFRPAEDQTYMRVYVEDGTLYLVMMLPEE
jgi:hypothetical protein